MSSRVISLLSASCRQELARLYDQESVPYEKPKVELNEEIESFKTVEIMDNPNNCLNAFPLNALRHTEIFSDTQRISLSPLLDKN